jgi:hypothetical protein
VSEGTFCENAASLSTRGGQIIMSVVLTIAPSCCIMQARLQ